MGRHYERLEGRECVFKTGDDEYIGVVTGADWQIGLTIQAKDIKDKYLMCINGMKSPYVKNIKFNHRMHRAGMAYVYDHVMKNQPVVAREYIKLMRSITTYSPSWHGPSATSCAFSQ